MGFEHGLDGGAHDLERFQERMLQRTAAKEITDRAVPISAGMFLFWGIGLLALAAFVIRQLLSNHR